MAGCMSVAKEIAPSTKSTPNTPVRRTMIFSQKIDILCQTDPIYEADIEAALLLKGSEERLIHLNGYPP
ncbi:MAG: hypothetical protein WAM14_17235 [Candidatus Nitrosopolaris sp.]